MQLVRTCSIPALSVKVKLIEAPYIQHIIITGQDKHLILVQYRTVQIILGLVPSAPKRDEIELDYARK